LISNFYAVPKHIRVIKDVGSNMSNKFRVIAAILVRGLVCAPCVLAGEAAPDHRRPDPPIEVCEAFPWDVPVEQSFSAESVLRWRRAMPEQGPRQSGTSLPRGQVLVRTP
jgi:hypothetical protein